MRAPHASSYGGFESHNQETVTRTRSAIGLLINVSEAILEQFD